MINLGTFKNETYLKNSESAPVGNDRLADILQ